MSFLWCFSQTPSETAVLWHCAGSVFYSMPPCLLSPLCSLHTSIMRFDDPPCLAALELKMTLVLQIKYPRKQKQWEKINRLQPFVYLSAYKFIPEYRALLISYGSSELPNLLSPPSLYWMDFLYQDKLPDKYIISCSLPCNLYLRQTIP